MRLSCDVSPSAASLHLLPFAVLPRDGAAVEPASTATFFLPRPRQGSALLTASFRGRALQGERLAVPEGFVGVVARVEPRAEKRRRQAADEEDEEQPEEEEEPSRVRSGSVKSVFDALVVWEHDVAPSACFGQWLAWPRLAAALHAAVPLGNVDGRNESEPPL